MTPPPRTFLPLPDGCVRARLARRRQRFIIEAENEAGPLLAHTNNTGAMLGLMRPGAEILLSPANNPKRKLPWTLEMVRVHGFWVGVNTLTPNRMLRLAVTHGRLPELGGPRSFQAEAAVGQSRLDGHVPAERGLPEAWLEAKNVTLVEDGRAAFPDAETERGRKHLRELTALAGRGAVVGLFFLVQRPDASCFGPADYIDPAYAELMVEALRAGVKAWALQADLSDREISLGRRLPLHMR
ncbi:MAG: sugar fermentation stimulation protein [Desulfovibrionales bacterium]|nr:sugar fermentation stimulation protein [Desulfovibrionales bacterium]